MWLDICILKEAKEPITMQLRLDAIRTLKTADAPKDHSNWHSYSIHSRNRCAIKYSSTEPLLVAQVMKTVIQTTMSSWDNHRNWAAASPS